jgi:tight adherence protein B
VIGLSSFWGTEAALYLAVLLVALAAFLLGWMLLGTAARRKKDRETTEHLATISGRGTGKHLPQVPVDRGGSGWIPASVTSFGRRFADKRGFAERLDAELEAASVNLRSGEFVVITVAGVFVGAILFLAIFRSPIFALLGAFVGGAGPTVALRVALKRRAEKLREQLPDVLTIMASSLRAGHSFLQALDTVAREIAQPAATEFQRVVAEIRLGRAAEEALEALAERVGSADFKWAVLAVNIQREVGGNLAEILDNVADTLRERAMMRRQVRVLTSEGRLSAWVLTLLPLGIALYLFITNPKYIGLLFSTKIGWVMVGGATILLTAGVLWMRKIVNIDV